MTRAAWVERRAIGLPDKRSLMSAPTTAEVDPKARHQVPVLHLVRPSAGPSGVRISAKRATNKRHGRSSSAEKGRELAPCSAYKGPVGYNTSAAAVGREAGAMQRKTGPFDAIPAKSFSAG